MNVGLRFLLIATLLAHAPPALSQAIPWRLEIGQGIYPVLRYEGLQSHVGVYLPPGPEGQRWPVIVYLHGSAQQGAPARELLNTALAKHVKSRTDFPFIVISPQLVADAPAWDPAAVHALLDEVLPKLPADGRNLYATGTSLGGTGVWRLAFERPARFAAIAPIATSERLAGACRIWTVPVWAFHNVGDKEFPPRNDSALVSALNRCKGKARITLYRKAGHNAWTETYANGALYEWFLAQPADR